MEMRFLLVGFDRKIYETAHKSTFGTIFYTVFAGNVSDAVLKLVYNAVDVIILNEDISSEEENKLNRATRFFSAPTPVKKVPASADWKTLFKAITQQMGEGTFSKDSASRLHSGRID